MQIEIKTTAYAQNAHYKAVCEAIHASGFKHLLQLGGKRLGLDEAVTLKTDAPRKVLEGLSLPKSTVKIRD